VKEKGENDINAYEQLMNVVVLGKKRYCKHMALGLVNIQEQTSGVER
jgi:hypothetical protein